MKYHFFWGGIYSNWYKCPIEINRIELERGLIFDTLGRKFNCSEQAMMFFKALLFEDYKIAEKIILESNPRKQKALGREIKNFDSESWDLVKEEIVLQILTCKFKQNFHLREQLIKENCDLFVEASPHDRIWGIGFDEKNALNNKDKWGENLLGKLITNVRNNLLNHLCANCGRFDDVVGTHNIDTCEECALNN